ncbi:MAG: hypothetical protein WC895_04680 [Candidatus Shapirobacteria bacterium]
MNVEEHKVPTIIFLHLVSLQENLRMKLPFQKVKIASVLDIPQSTLSPEVWDLSTGTPILHPTVKDKILRGFKDVVKVIPEHSVQDWPFYVIGSITGTQWTSSTDIDVHILALEEVSPGELVDFIQRLRSVPSTTIGSHPINFFVHGRGELPPYAHIYDIKADTWITGAPTDISYYQQAVEQMDTNLKDFLKTFDASLGEVWRDIKDYNDLALEINNRGKVSELIPLLLKKKQEILTDVTQLLGEFEQARRERREFKFTEDPQFQMSLPNLRYKLLEHYGYNKFIKVLENVQKKLALVAKLLRKGYSAEAKLLLAEVVTPSIDGIKVVSP